DYSGGHLAASSIVTTSRDGLTTNTSRDFNGNGVQDEYDSDVLAKHADGSSVETILVYQASHVVSGVETALTNPLLTKRTTVPISADGKKTTTSVDVNVDGTDDQTSITTRSIDGSVVTDTANDAAAKAVTPTLGDVVWRSALGVVASHITTTTSADG